MNKQQYANMMERRQFSFVLTARQRNAWLYEAGSLEKSGDHQDGVRGQHQHDGRLRRPESAGLLGDPEQLRNHGVALSERGDAGGTAASFELYETNAAENAGVASVYEHWNAVREQIHSWFAIAETSILDFCAAYQ